MLPATFFITYTEPLLSHSKQSNRITQYSALSADLHDPTPPLLTAAMFTKKKTLCRLQVGLVEALLGPKTLTRPHMITIRSGNW